MRRTLSIATFAGAALLAGPPLAADQGRTGDGTDYGCGGHPATNASALTVREDHREEVERPQQQWRNWWYLNRACLLSELSYRVAGPAAMPPVQEKWRDDVRAALREAMDSPVVAIASEATLALGRGGDPRDIDIVRKAAGDVRLQQNIRRRAALALGLMPVEPATSAAVRDTLISVAGEAIGNNDDRLELWSFAVCSLGLRGDASGVPKLADFIKRHRDWNDADHQNGVHREVIGEAIGSLGLFRDPVLTPELTSTLTQRPGDGNLHQRRMMFASFACYGLARLGDKSALPALCAAAADERYPVRRAALLASGALAESGDDKTVAVLLSSLATDKDDLARALAAISLGRTGADAAPAALMAAYAHDTPLVRAYSALGLGLFARIRQKREVTDFLLAELGAKHAPDETGALAIANGLARNFPSAGRLVDIARPTGEPIMRSHAAFALGLLNAEGVAPQVLIELLDDGDPVIRHEAGLALGLARRRDGVDALIRIVTEGKSVTDRGSAAVVLGRIAGAEAAPVLLKVLRSDKEMNGLRICAAHGLGLLLDRGEGRKLGLLGADVNWVNWVHLVWSPTEVIDQLLLISD